MRRVLAGAAGALVAEGLLIVIVVGLGGAPVNADAKPSALETRLFGMALRASVARNVAADADPLPPSPDDLTAGAEIYDDMCARCHGARAGGANALATAFYPPAPLLPGHRSTYREVEILSIIKHGIRNTAMPAWGRLLSDDDIRQVAALVKRFDGPSAQAE
jgi:mono/diheme cytochrome c family protein